MRTSRIAVAIAGMAAVAGLAVAAGPAAAASSPVVGHVYVNDNSAVSNAVAGFDRHANGSLTPIPGSPFATGGAGTGSSVASEGALQRAGRFLVAVDPGSNQLSVLRIGAGGKLSSVGAPVWSHGNQPVSITVHDHLVYVANAGDGGVNYTGFRLASSGRLRHLRGSTVALPDGSQPGQVLLNATGTKLAGTRVGSSLIDSFAVRPNGRLKAAPGSPYTAQGLGPFGSEYRPSKPWQLFVSNAHDGTGNGTVSAYRVAADGTLSSVGGSPFPDHQTAPCWVEITHNGRILFAVNTATPSISSYRIGAGGALHVVSSTGFNSPTGLSPFDARLSPGGGTLWVVDNSGSISGFRVHGGHLHEFAGSPTPTPAGAVPFGIVVT
jgi:6-phosphogluconolactonase (cycloisomerase 2 family)